MTIRATNPQRLFLATTVVAALSSHGCTVLIDESTTPICEAVPAEWQAVLDGTKLDRAALSVWGASPTDVYVVGGPVGNSGFESLLLHFDGSTWTDMHPGGTDTYWRVAGSNDDDVWMVGEHGRITHWDGNVLEEHDSGTNATLWGVWAASTQSAWAVGGTPEGGTSADNDIVLHWDGETWSRVTLPGEPLGVSLYKIYGTSAENGTDNLYAVGERGVIWHRQNGEWKLESDPPLASGKLITVSGCSATEVYAVGDNDLLRSDGVSWVRDESIVLGNLAAGVSCNIKKGASRAENELLVVGNGGLKQRFVGGVWLDESDSPPYVDLHSSWSDGEGAYWAVGGDFASLPTPGAARLGVVARHGCGHVSGKLAK